MEVYNISLPVVLKSVLTLLFTQKVNCCVSGGYAAYRGLLTDQYGDIDIFVHKVQNRSFSLLHLIRALGLHVVSVNKRINYIDTWQIPKHKYRFDRIVVRTAENEQFDFIEVHTLHCNFSNNFLFSEMITSFFDIDVCCISIYMDVDDVFKLRTNSNFKIYSKDTDMPYTDSEKLVLKSLNETPRYRKYSERLKPQYQMFYKHLGPEFDVVEFLCIQMVLQQSGGEVSSKKLTIETVESNEEIGRLIKTFEKTCCCKNHTSKTNSTQTDDN